ncbi:MAG TPA: aldehyde dehydrogenase family protein [Acidimicrobiia bacterium]|nr:aldehyde dehydrogenase family protein [Acidimicrobiia bacterium]
MITATPFAAVDASLDTLSRRASAWAMVPAGERAALLRRVAARFLQVSDDLVADAIVAKGVDRSYGGEDWVSGPISFLRTCRFLADTLEAISRTGRVPLPDAAFTERPDGQVTVAVVPADRWDRMLYRGWNAKVWMEPDIPLAEARQQVGGYYTKGTPPLPGVAAILGAGNVASIAPLDLVHKLFVAGRVALVKFSPVNEYIGPYVEHAFAPLVAAGFVRFAYGHADVGAHLVQHPLVDEVHVTGSEHTFNLIVFGPGEEGRRRQAEDRPIVDKPVTAELGNVSPVVVIPGDWSPRALESQARHVATQVLQNVGFNCNAAKVLVLPGRWPQRTEFVERVAALLAARPSRPAYYPGTQGRYERAVSAAPRVRALGEHRDGAVPPTLLEGFDAAQSSPVFDEEAFCQVMAVVDIDQPDPGRFLDAAVEFCNDRLRGTLNATLLVDPATAHRPDTGLDRAVERLRYGSIGVNVWAAAAFPLGVTPWGAFPGHRRNDVQSGLGFVHNARLVDRPQKSVITAPFVMTPAPPWSVFHRRATAALRAVARFEADPGPLRFAAVLASALRP